MRRSRGRGPDAKGPVPAAAPGEIGVRELCYTYPDGTPALAGITFQVQAGESVALVGANGAGKSTLLLHLNGALAPTHGEVRVGGQAVTPASLATVRRQVGMVFQDPDDQLFLPTVADDVAFGPVNLGLAAAEVKVRVSNALAQVGAGHLADRAPHRLSAGEKRAVAIATVLAMAPQILVLDEPSSTLDPRARRRLISLLQGFSHTRIVASHDLDLVLELCQRTIVLRDGRIMADGPTTTVLVENHGLLADCGLEPPLRLQSCPRCGRQSP